MYTDVCLFNAHYPYWRFCVNSLHMLLAENDILRGIEKPKGKMLLVHELRRATALNIKGQRCSLTSVQVVMCGLPLDSGITNESKLQELCA